MITRKITCQKTIVTRESVARSSQHGMARASTRCHYYYCSYHYDDYGDYYYYDDDVITIIE